jgi:hypothetical protein
MRALSLMLGVAAGCLAVRAEGKERACTLEGKPPEPFIVDVTPKGAGPLHVRVSDLAVSVRPEGVGPAHVDVKGAITFEGTAQRVPYRLKRAVDVNGILDLQPGTAGLTLHRLVRAKIVDAELALGDLVFRGLIVPCDAISIEAVAAPEPGRSEEEHGDRLRPAAKVLQLYQGRGTGGHIELELKGALDALELRRTEVEGRWWRVRARWLDGTALTAWVPKEQLQPAGRTPKELDEPLPTANTCSDAPKEQPGSRLAHAAVRAGTSVYAARYLGPWATVSGAAPLTVRYRQKDDWVEVVSAPGLATAGECAGSTVLGDAWVPRAAVRLPDAPPPPEHTP